MRLDVYRVSWLVIDGIKIYSAMHALDNGGRCVRTYYDVIKGITLKRRDILHLLRLSVYFYPEFLKYLNILK